MGVTYLWLVEGVSWAWLEVEVVIVEMAEFQGILV